MKRTLHLADIIHIITENINIQIIIYGKLYKDCDAANLLKTSILNQPHDLGVTGRGGQDIYNFIQN